MKKFASIFLALFLTLVLLVGCGSASKSCDSSVNGSGEGQFATAEESFDKSESETPQNPAVGDAKLIYRGNLDMETTAFDDITDDLKALVQQFGGYIENTELDNHRSGYRSASYTVRVPVASYHSFFTRAGELCHTRWQNETVENVTRYYYDTDGRLKTQETKLARLQELLSKAETMEDIIAIESAISETEELIESLSGELRYYDDLIGYATIYISICEVSRLSNAEEPAIGFGSRLVQALSRGWDSFVDGLEDFLVWFAYNIMWVAIWAAIIAAVVALIRKRKKRSGYQPKLKRKQKVSESSKADDQNKPMDQ